ncbi:MAG TPA: hypothetical protein VKS22_05045 [Candidatus Binataceae bacterium]|nr:hypothetical protein [Candidatus Binataceae bacterium]
MNDPRTGFLRRAALAVALFLTPGALGCGPSQEEVRQELHQANEAQAKAEHAEEAARQAQAAAAAATAAADKARKDVDAATVEINRVADHVAQLNRERDDQSDDEGDR